MNAPIVAQSSPSTQAVPVAVTPSRLDGCPVGHRIELAAMLVHEEIRDEVGPGALCWLECTAAYRNTIRAGILALVLDAPEGRA